MIAVKDRGWRAHRERTAKDNGLRFGHGDQRSGSQKQLVEKLPGTSSFSDRLISRVARWRCLEGDAIARSQRRGACALAFDTLCSFQGAGCVLPEFLLFPLCTAACRQQGRAGFRVSAVKGFFNPFVVGDPLRAARTFGPVAVVSKSCRTALIRGTAAAERNCTASAAGVQARTELGRSALLKILAGSIIIGDARRCCNIWRSGPGPSSRARSSEMVSLRVGSRAVPAGRTMSIRPATRSEPIVTPRRQARARGCSGEDLAAVFVEGDVAYSVEAAVDLSGRRPTRAGGRGLA